MVPGSISGTGDRAVDKPDQNQGTHRGMLGGGEGCEDTFGRQGDGCAGTVGVSSKVTSDSLPGSLEGDEEGAGRAVGGRALQTEGGACHTAPGGDWLRGPGTATWPVQLELRAWVGLGWSGGRSREPRGRAGRAS